MEEDAWQNAMQYSAEIFSREIFRLLPESVIDRMEREDELSRLHAVIARLSGMHRDILVQYSIRNQSIQEISNCLQVPEGTVKRRLFDARKQVKEGMEKMPTVTKLSYAPQEMEFWLSGKLQRAEAMQDILGKQVLAGCYERPRSVEELSEELQVASVYLEDKIHRLCALDVLKPAGKKFLANFIVISKNHVTEMMRELDVVYMDLCQSISNILEESREEIMEIGFYGADFPEKYLNLMLYYFPREIEGVAIQKVYQASAFFKGKRGGAFYGSGQGEGVRPGNGGRGETCGLPVQGNGMDEELQGGKFGE